MLNGFTSYDAALIKTAKASTTAADVVASDALDLGAIDSIGVRSEPFELEVAIPAFTATDLPSSATLAIALQSCADASFAAGVTTAFTQTIGDGVAYAGGKVRYRVTLKDAQYWRVAVTTAGSPAATAAKEITLSYVC